MNVIEEEEKIPIKDKRQTADTPQSHEIRLSDNWKANFINIPLDRPRLIKRDRQINSKSIEEEDKSAH